MTSTNSAHLASDSSDDDVAESILDVAKAADCGRSSVYKAIAEGSLVARKLFGKTIILRRDRKAWLRALPVFTSKAA